MVILPSIRRKYMVSRIPKGATVPMSDCVVTLDSDSVQYTGSARTVGVTVAWEGATLAVNTDYTLSFANNTNVGPATVTVTGMGQFSGSVTRTFYVTGQQSPGAWNFDLSAMSTTPVNETTIKANGAATNIQATQMNVDRTYPGHMLIGSNGLYLDWEFSDEDYDLSTIGSIEYRRKGGFVSSALGYVICDSGTRMYFTSQDSYTNVLMWATLPTAYDISTASYQGSISHVLAARAAFMAFSSDGRKFLYKSAEGSTVYCVNLGTAFRFNSFQDEESFDLGTMFGCSAVYGMCVSKDGYGAVLGVIVDNRPKLVRLSLSVPFDFSSASIASVSPVLLDSRDNPNGVLVDEEGSRAIVWFSSGAVLREYSLA